MRRLAIVVVVAVAVTALGWTSPAQAQRVAVDVAVSTPARAQATTVPVAAPVARKTRPAVMLTAVPLQVRPGRPFRLLGAVTPATAGARVQLFEQVKGAWVYRASTVAKKGGKFTFTRREKTPGGRTYQARVLRGKVVVARSQPAGPAILGSVTRAIPQPNLVKLDTASVTTVTGDPNTGQQVTLAAGIAPPAVGSVLQVTDPNGPVMTVLGTVTAVDTTGPAPVVQVTPATLSDAYQQFDSTSAVPLPDEVVVLEDRSKYRISAVGLKCSTTSGVKLDDVTIDLSKLTGDLEVNVKTRYIHFLLRGQPTVSLGATLTGVSASCSATLSLPPIPIGTTGLVLEVAPKISVDLSGKLTAKMTYTQTFLAGFDALPGRSPMNIWAASSKLTPSVDGSGSVSAAIGLRVRLGVAGRVGVQGDAGPKLAGKISANLTPTQVKTCLKASAELNLALSLFADVWVTSWNVDLVQKTYDLGTFYDQCWTRQAGAIPPKPSPTASGAPASSSWRISNVSADGSETYLQTGTMTVSNSSLRDGDIVSLRIASSELYTARGGYGPICTPEEHGTNVGFVFLTNGQQWAGAGPTRGSAWFSPSSPLTSERCYGAGGIEVRYVYDGQATFHMLPGASYSGPVAAAFSLPGDGTTTVSVSGDSIRY